MATQKRKDSKKKDADSPTNETVLCTVCDQQVQRADWEEHIFGKKHLKKEKQLASPSPKPSGKKTKSDRPKKAKDKSGASEPPNGDEAEKEKKKKKKKKPKDKEAKDKEPTTSSSGSKPAEKAKPGSSLLALSLKNMPAAPDYQGTLGVMKMREDKFTELWVELRGTTVKLFDKPHGKDHGTVDLSLMSVLDDPEDHLSFVLRGAGDSNYLLFLRAKNNDEKNKWVSSFQENIVVSSPQHKNTGGASSFIEREDSEMLFDAYNSSTEKDDGCLGGKLMPNRQQTATTSLTNNTTTHPATNNTNDANGTPPEPPKKRMIPADFEFLTVVGRGSYGKVMKVRRRETGKIYAMKVMNKEALISTNMVDYTRCEKELLSRLGHPFVVSLYWAFQTKSKLYLIMEYLSGGELYVHIKRKGKLGDARSRFYAASIVLAFEYLHSKKIMFRDLKPENVVLDKDGFACLTDFGMARRGSAENGEKCRSFCGTDAYISPEMIKGDEYGCENDWWSLGILLYEMLYGDPPWVSDNCDLMYDMIQEDPLKFPEKPSCPKTAKDLLRKLLDKNPETRLRTPQEIKQHPFFQNIDWHKLARKDVTPPYVPDVQKDDTKFFDERFVAERPCLSVCKQPSQAANAQFAGFSFDGTFATFTPTP